MFRVRTDTKRSSVPWTFSSYTSRLLKCVLALAFTSHICGQVAQQIYWLQSNQKHMLRSSHPCKANSSLVFEMPFFWLNCGTYTVCMTVFLCHITGGCNEVCGEHWSQLPLSLAGVLSLCVRTLSEGRRSLPPQGEVTVRRRLTSVLFFRLCLHSFALSLHWSLTGFPCSLGSPVYLLLMVILWHMFDVNV